MEVLLPVVVGLKIVASVTADFSSRVDALLNNFDTTFNVRCSDEARRMAATFQSMDKRNQNAVAIVNLYKQNCEVGRSIYDEDDVSTEFRALLNEAIILLSQNHGFSGGTVYSSECDHFIEVGVYRIGKFLSTFTNIEKAFSFGSWKGCIVVFSDVQGLKVGEFSKYSNEEEILIASTASYDVLFNTLIPVDSCYGPFCLYGWFKFHLSYMTLKYPQVEVSVLANQLEVVPGYKTSFYELLSVLGLW